MKIDRSIVAVSEPRLSLSQEEDPTEDDQEMQLRQDVDINLPRPEIVIEDVVEFNNLRTSEWTGSSVDTSVSE